MSHSFVVYIEHWLCPQLKDRPLLSSLLSTHITFHAEPSGSLRTGISNVPESPHQLVQGDITSVFKCLV